MFDLIKNTVITNGIYYDKKQRVIVTIIYSYLINYMIKWNQHSIESLAYPFNPQFFYVL